MAITNKKGQVLAPDLEFRFAEGINARGIKTEIGGKTLVLLDSQSKYKDTIRGSIAHELVHYLENRKGYDQLAAYAYRIAKNEKIQKYLAVKREGRLESLTMEEETATFSARK